LQPPGFPWNRNVAGFGRECGNVPAKWMRLAQRCGRSALDCALNRFRFRAHEAGKGIPVMIDKQTAARRGRWAVASIFLVNGFLIGSWAPHIPQLLSRLAISETTLGVLILVFGLGAII